VGDDTDDARRALVEEHLPLVRYVANRISQRIPRHMDGEDLVNAGVIGLIDAVDKFDEAKASFKTYAEFRIEGAILDFLRGEDWVPRTVRARGRRLERAARQAAQRLGREPQPEEVADELGTTLEKLAELRREVATSIGPIPYDTETGEPIELPNDAPDSDELFLAEEADKRVHGAISSLPEPHRSVVMLYYWSEKALSEIGDMMGLTESRVCQLHTRALRILEVRLRGH
jgi:RNA polymerase sigma factor FliA